MKRSPTTFFISKHDGSAWGRYADDRPNKFYGHPDNLPKRAKKALGLVKKKDVS